MKSFKTFSIFMMLLLAGYATVFAQPQSNTRFIAFSNITSSSLSIMSTRPPAGSQGRIILKSTDAVTALREVIATGLGTVDLTNYSYTTDDIQDAVNNKLGAGSTTTCVHAFIGYGTTANISTGLQPNTQYAFAVVDYVYDRANNKLKFWSNGGTTTGWPSTNNPRAVKTLPSATRIPPVIVIDEVYATGFRVKVTSGLTDDSENLVYPNVEYTLGIKYGTYQNLTTITINLGELDASDIDYLNTNGLIVNDLPVNTTYTVALVAQEAGVSTVYSSVPLYPKTTPAQAFAYSNEPADAAQLGLDIGIITEIMGQTVTSNDRSFKIELTFSPYTYDNYATNYGGAPVKKTFRMNTAEPVVLSWGGGSGDLYEINMSGKITCVSQYWEDSTKYVFEYEVKSGEEIDGAVSFGIKAFADGQNVATEITHTNLNTGTGDADLNKIIFEMKPPKLLVDGGFSMKSWDGSEGDDINDLTIRPNHLGVQFLFQFNEQIKLGGLATEDFPGEAYDGADENTALANNFMKIDFTGDDGTLATLIDKLRNGNVETKPTIAMADAEGKTTVTVTWLFPKGTSGGGNTAAEIANYIETLKDYAEAITINLYNTLVTDYYGNQMDADDALEVGTFQINRSVPTVTSIEIIGLDEVGYANCGDDGTLAGYINENSTTTGAGAPGGDKGFKVEITFDRAMNTASAETVRLVKEDGNTFTLIDESTYTTPEGGNPGIGWTEENKKLTWTVTGLKDLDYDEYVALINSDLYVRVADFAAANDGPTMLPTVTYVGYDSEGAYTTAWENILAANGAMRSLVNENYEAVLKPFRLDLINEFVAVAFNTYNTEFYAYAGVDIDNYITTIYPKDDAAPNSLIVALMLRDNNEDFINLFNAENKKAKLTKVEKYELGSGYTELTGDSYFIANGSDNHLVTENKLCKINGEGNGYDVTPKHPGLNIPIILGENATNPDNKDNLYRLTFEYTNSLTGRAKTCTLQTYVDYTRPTITAIGVKTSEGGVSNEDVYINSHHVTEASPSPGYIERDYLVVFDRPMEHSTFTKTSGNIKFYVEDIDGEETSYGYTIDIYDINWSVGNDGENIARVTIRLTTPDNLENITYNKISLEVINHEDIKSTTGAALDQNYTVMPWSPVGGVEGGIFAGVVEESVIKSAYIIDTEVPDIASKKYNTDDAVENIYYNDDDQYDCVENDAHYIFECDANVINSHRIGKFDNKLIITFVFDELVKVTGDLIGMLKIGLTGDTKAASSIKYYRYANDDEPVADPNFENDMYKKIVFEYDVQTGEAGNNKIGLLDGQNNDIVVTFDNEYNYISDKAGNKIHLVNQQQPNVTNDFLTRAILYDVTPNNTTEVKAIRKNGTPVPVKDEGGAEIPYISKHCKVQFNVEAAKHDGTNDRYIVKLVRANAQVINAPDVAEPATTGEHAAETLPLELAGNFVYSEGVLTSIKTLAGLFPNHDFNAGENTEAHKYHIVVKTLDQAKNKTVEKSSKYTVAKIPTLRSAITPQAYDPNEPGTLSNKKVDKVEFYVNSDVEISTTGTDKKVIFATDQNFSQSQIEEEIATNKSNNVITYTPGLVGRVNLALNLNTFNLSLNNTTYYVKIEEGAFVDELDNEMKEATWSIQTLPELAITSVEFVKDATTNFGETTEDNPAKVKATDKLGIKIKFNQNIIFLNQYVKLTLSNLNLYKPGDPGPQSVSFVYTAGASYAIPTTEVTLLANDDGNIINGMFTADPEDLTTGVNLGLKSGLGHTENNYTPKLTGGSIIAGGVPQNAVATTDKEPTKHVRVDAAKPVVTHNYPAGTEDAILLNDGNYYKIYTNYVTETPKISDLKVFQYGDDQKGFKIEDHNISTDGTKLVIVLNEEPTSYPEGNDAYDYTDPSVKSNTKFPNNLEEGAYYAWVEHTDKFGNFNEGEDEADKRYYFVVDENPVIDVEVANMDMIQGLPNTLSNNKTIAYTLTEQFPDIADNNKGKTTLTFSKTGATNVGPIVVQTSFEGDASPYAAMISINDKQYIGGQLSNEQTLATTLNTLDPGEWTVTISVTDRCGHTGTNTTMTLNVHSRPQLSAYKINGQELTLSGAYYVLLNDGTVGFTDNYIEFVFDKDIEEYSDNILTNLNVTYPEFEATIEGSTLKFTQKADQLTSNTDYTFQLLENTVKEKDAQIVVGNIASETVKMTTRAAQITAIERITAATNMDDPGEYVNKDKGNVFFRITFEAPINEDQMPTVTLKTGGNYLTGLTVANNNTTQFIPNNNKEVYVEITDLPEDASGAIGLIGIDKVAYNAITYTQTTDAEEYNVNRRTLDYDVAYDPEQENNKTKVNSKINLVFNNALADAASSSNFVAPTLEAGYNDGTPKTTALKDNGVGTIGTDYTTITYELDNNTYFEYVTDYTITATENGTVTDLWGHTKAVEGDGFTTEAAPEIISIVRINADNADPGLYTKADFVYFKVTFDKEPLPTPNANTLPAIWHGGGTGNVETSNVEPMDVSGNNYPYKVTVTITDGNDPAKGLLKLNPSEIYNLTNLDPVGNDGNNQWYDVNRNELDYVVAYDPVQEGGKTKVNSKITLEFTNELAHGTTAPTLTAGYGNNETTALKAGVISEDKKKITYELYDANTFFEYGAEYTITVTGTTTVSDKWGNSLTVENWQFETEDAPVIQSIVRIDADGNYLSNEYTKAEAVYFKVTFDKQPLPKPTNDNLVAAWKGTTATGDVETDASADGITAMMSGGGLYPYKVKVNITDGNPDKAKGILELTYLDPYTLAADATNETYNVNREDLQVVLANCDPRGDNTPKNTEELVLAFNHVLATSTLKPALTPTNVTPTPTGGDATATYSEVVGSTIKYALSDLNYGQQYKVTAGDITVTDLWGNECNVQNELTNKEWTFVVEAAPVITSIMRHTPTREYTNAPNDYVEFLVTFNKLPNPSPVYTDFTAEWNNAGTGTLGVDETVTQVTDETYRVKVNITKVGDPAKAQGELKLTSNSYVTTAGEAGTANNQIYDVNTGPLAVDLATSTPLGFEPPYPINTGHLVLAFNNDLEEGETTPGISKTVVPTLTAENINEEADDATVGSADNATVSGKTITYTLSGLAYRQDYYILGPDGEQPVYVTDKWGNTYDARDIGGTEWGFTTEAAPVALTIVLCDEEGGTEGISEFTNDEIVYFKVTFNKAPVPEITQTPKSASNLFATDWNDQNTTAAVTGVVKDENAIGDDQDKVYIVTVTITDTETLRAVGTLGLKYNGLAPKEEADNKTYDVNRKPLTCEYSLVNADNTQFTGTENVPVDAKIVLTFGNELPGDPAIPKLVAEYYKNDNLQTTALKDGAFDSEANTITYAVADVAGVTGYFAYNKAYTVAKAAENPATVTDKWGNTWQVANIANWTGFKTEEAPAITNIWRYDPDKEYTNAPGGTVKFKVEFNGEPKPITKDDFVPYWTDERQLTTETINSVAINGDNTYIVEVTGIPENAVGILGITPSATSPYWLYYGSPALTGTSDFETYNINREALTCTPTPTGTSVGVDADLVLTFNHHLATTDNNAPELTTNPAINLTGGTVVNNDENGGTYTITYSLANGYWAYGQEYAVTVMNNDNRIVKDLWGNECDLRNADNGVQPWEFTTKSRPTIVSSVPTSEQGVGGTVVDIPINTSITITFNEAVALVNTTAEATLTPNGGQEIPLTGIILANSDDKTLTFTLPTSTSLTYSTQYKLSIDENQVQSYANGDKYKNAKCENVVTFTTEATPPAPKVSGSNPGDGAVNVPVTTGTITITFDRDITLVGQTAEATLTPVDPADTPIPLTGGAMVPNSNNTITFTLSNNLNYATQYRLSIEDNQVKNVAGIENEKNENVATFTTVSRPKVTVTNPTGAEGEEVSVNLTTITVTFDKNVTATNNVSLTLTGGTNPITMTSATVDGATATFTLPTGTVLAAVTQYTATLAENSFAATENQSLLSEGKEWTFTTGPATLPLTLSRTTTTITVEWYGTGKNYTAYVSKNPDYSSSETEEVTNASGLTSVTFTGLDRNTLHYVKVEDTDVTELGTGSIKTRRLKESIVSMDGSFEITEVTPMPISTNAQFSLAASKAGHLTVAIYGLAGEKLMDVLSTDLNVGDELIIPMSFAEFASGTYTLVVRLDGETIQRRIVINK